MLRGGQLYLVPLTSPPETKKLSLLLALVLVDRRRFFSYSTCSPHCPSAAVLMHDALYQATVRPSPSGARVGPGPQAIRFITFPAPLPGSYLVSKPEDRPRLQSRR